MKATPFLFSHLFFFSFLALVAGRGLSPTFEDGEDGGGAVVIGESQHSSQKHKAERRSWLEGAGPRGMA